MYIISKKSERSTETLLFSPVDLLEEGAKEFLESGSNPTKLISCVMKIFTATELIFKDALREINPALILDGIDEDGLQIIKIFELDDRILNKKILEKFNLKTISFICLLKRAKNFFRIENTEYSLSKFSKIRNQLVHNGCEIDVKELNILLAKYILPFLESFLMQYEKRPISTGNKFPFFRLDSNLWDKINNLKKEAGKLFETELSKKIYQHRYFFEKLSKDRIDFLLDSAIEKRSTTEVFDENNIRCPACEKDSMSLIIDVDFDWNPDGMLENAFLIMRCRVCELELDENEIDYILFNLKRFIKDSKARKKYEEIALQYGKHSITNHYDYR